MSELSERNKDAIKKSGLSQRELESKTGIPHSAIQRYASGDTDRVPIGRIEILARALCVSAEYLLGWEDSTFTNIMPIDAKRIPFLGAVACGKPVYADEQRESYVELGTSVKADFCLRASGDSMTGARIYDGDIVFCRKQEMVNNGEIAVVVIDDEATLKRVYYDRAAQVLQLVAENPKYQPLVYIGEQLNHVFILGKAVAFQSDVQ